MKVTVPIFVVGSGRSGTFSLYEALSALPKVEARHEPWCEQVQKLGCLRHAGAISDEAVEFQLKLLHGNTVCCSEAEYWVSIGNKESWLIDPLAELFSDAKFIWLVRDPRKSTLSYYHKLKDEHYDDLSVKALIDHLTEPSILNLPALEKRYWWPVPKTVSERSEFLKWDRWRRVCWHANEILRMIDQAVVSIGVDFEMCYLEDMVQDFGAFETFAYDANLLELSRDDLQVAWHIFKHPSNVHEPVNCQMTADQEAIYREMCGEIHEWLGYGWGPLDEVEYDDG